MASPQDKHNKGVFSAETQTQRCLSNTSLKPRWWETSSSCILKSEGLKNVINISKNDEPLSISVWRLQHFSFYRPVNKIQFDHKKGDLACLQREGVVQPEIFKWRGGDPNELHLVHCLFSILCTPSNWNIHLQCLFCCSPKRHLMAV